MNYREIWRLSKAPYVELAYRSTVMTRGSSRGTLGRRDPVSMVRSMKRSAQVSKLLITAFVAGGIVFSFAQFYLTRTPAGLVSAITLSLVLSLAYVVLYSLQVLPSFSASGPFSLLTSLPLSERELSLTAIFSIIRTFDIVVVVAVAVQVGAVAFLTGSVLATLVMALAAVANMGFGVAISVWLASLFQRNVSRGGRGRGASILRFVFLISWGLAAASLGFLFNLINYVLPALDGAVSGTLSQTALPIVFALVHPFTAGLAIGSLAYPSLSSGSPNLGLASAVSFAALVGYIMLSYGAARWTIRAAVRVAHGSTVTVVRQRATEFLLKIRRPVPAYVVKDTRVASKSPSTAFIFALPVLEAFIIVLQIRDPTALRPLVILPTTALLCFFSMISASVLLNTEGSGLDYTMSLPLSARVIVLAKSAVATVAFLPVPVVIGVILLLERPSSEWLVVVPLLQIASVSAATSAELSFFIQSYRKAGTRQTSAGIETRGLNLMSASALLRFAAALIVAGVLILAPLGVYAGAFILTRNHGTALASMALVSLGEFSGVQIYLRRRF